MQNNVVPRIRLRNEIRRVSVNGSQLHTAYNRNMMDLKHLSIIKNTVLKTHLKFGNPVLLHRSN